MFCEDLRVKANVKVNGVTETKSVIVAWACNGLWNGSRRTGEYVKKCRVSMYRQSVR